MEAGHSYPHKVLSTLTAHDFLASLIDVPVK